MLEQRLAKSEMIEYDWNAGKQAAGAGGSKSVRSGQYMKSQSDEDSDFEG